MKFLMHFFLFCLIAFAPAETFAQEKYTISGEIRESRTGETMIGAVVFLAGTPYGATTNNFGYYSITAPAGEYQLKVSFVGFQEIVRSLQLNKNEVINFNLDEYNSRDLVIQADRNRNTESTDMGRIELPIDQIKKMPVVFGEVDILKTIALLPGVQSAGEGNTGFYVRGGGIDQNLILLDNATVYNASHLFGFFSVFNADAVKNIELFKGGVPSGYGGRLSSVLDISLRDGNYKEFHGTGGVGTIASRFTAEGPIKKDTSSFIISGRRTYIDFLLKPLINSRPNIQGTGYYFYDLNAKFNYKLGSKDWISLSAYLGRDVFSFNSAKAGFSTKIPWGNATSTLRWNHVFSPKLFMNTLFYFTDYSFSFEGGQEEFTFGLKSGIRDYGSKIQFSYFPNPNHKVKWGVDYTYHIFTPNNTYASSGDTQFNLNNSSRLNSHESAAYIQDEWDINEKLKVNIGLRQSYFLHTGSFTRYVYPETTGLIGAGSPETITYGNGEKVADYWGFEPRISGRYLIKEGASIKAGYNRNFQYIHLNSFSPTSLPTDVWLPSTDRLRPQFSDQYSIGYFRDFKENKWESSVELYYKDMFNVSEYQEGADPSQTVNDNIDNLLWFGKGWSYGAEFFLKRNAGNLTGWIGYTWAKTMRQFDEINEGRPFPSRWDRRHDFNFVMNYKINERADIGFVFVYATGNAITLPTSRYFYQGNVIDVYGDRNSFRMAPYHRADISLNLISKNSIERQEMARLNPQLKKRVFVSSWNFSIYNLYNRRNPYFIYFAAEGDFSQGSFQTKAYQVSLFPILPSVTWNFEF
jgi:TonB dependent receptor/CarboxypepD_reg-like domain/TonB-dependent Receptor Plug Domain